MTTIVNKRTHTPTPDDVYIGRGSVWGNPFKIGIHGNRNSVIARYRTYMRSRVLRNPMLMKGLLQLEGMTLVCYCKPQACHGDVLIELIEEMME